MIQSTGIHHVNKGFFVVCPEQNPETITTNVESHLWTSPLHKTGRLSHYKLPVLSFPVKPVYISTVSVPLWPAQFALWSRVTLSNDCLYFLSVCVFDSRSATPLLTMVLDWVTFPLSMEDKTQSSGMAGLGSVWLGALWRWRSECKKWLIKMKEKCLLIRRSVG